MASLSQIINKEAMDNIFLISELTLECGDVSFPIVGVTVNASLSDARIGGSACEATVIPVTQKGNNAVNELTTEDADKAFDAIKSEQPATIRLRYSAAENNQEAVIYSGYVISKQTTFNTNPTNFKKTYKILLGHPAAVLAAHHVEAPYMWDNRNGLLELSSLRYRLEGLKEASSEFATATKDGFNIAAYIVELLDKGAKIVGDTADMSLSSLINISEAPRLNSELQFTDAQSQMPLRNKLRSLVCSGCLQNSEWSVLINILGQLDLLAVPSMDFSGKSYYTNIIPNLALATIPEKELAARTVKHSEVLNYYQNPPTRKAGRKKAIAVYVDADNNLMGSGTSSKSQSAYCMLVQGYDADGNPVLIDGEVDAVGVNEDKSTYYRLKTGNSVTKISGLPINRIQLPDWIKTPKNIGNAETYLEFRKKVAKTFATSFYMSGLVKTGSLDISVPFQVMLDRLRYNLGKVVKVVIDGDKAVYGQLEYISYSISADSTNFKVSADAKIGTIRNQAEQDAWGIAEDTANLLFIYPNKS